MESVLCRWEQVTLTQGDYAGKGVIVSWVTPEKAKPEVRYGIKKGVHPYEAKGITTQYEYYNYTSGFIHHVTISDLQVLNLDSVFLCISCTFWMMDF